MYEYMLSIDLGRFQDYSALHLIRVVPVRRINKDNAGEIFAYNNYHVIYQARTTEPYTSLVSKVDQVLSQDRIRNLTAVIVDGTGVGTAVVEMFKYNPIVVMMHGGDTLSIRQDPPGYSVPKRDIVAAMQVVFQTGRIKIAKNLPYNEQLAKELQNFLMTTSAAGNDLYANLKDSIHDDMVISLGLGLWYGEKFIKFYMKPVSMIAEGYDSLHPSNS